MCVNPANANNIVILDRYELKFPHNASAGNEFVHVMRSLGSRATRASFMELPPTISSTRFTFWDIGTGMSYVYEGRNGVDVP